MKQAVFQHLAQIGKALSSPGRLDLLELLCQSPCTVDHLARKAGMSVGNASQHLRILRQSGLVEAEKDGLFVTYRIAGPDVASFLLQMRLLGERRVAEVERVVRMYLESRNPFEAVDRTTLLERVRTGQAIVIDVRPPEEYEAGHLAGARSVPLAQLEAMMRELPRDCEIVAYCRGPYCLMAIEAVERLTRKGFRASRMEDGVLEWHAQSLPIEGSGSWWRQTAAPHEAQG